MSRGWHGEPTRHSLASKGIQTKSYVEPLRARSPKYPKLIHPNEILTSGNLDLIKTYAEKSGDRIEWICDLDLKEDGQIKLEDSRFDGDDDESFLSWDPDDPAMSVGFMHSHPPSNFPWFSSTDFTLMFKIHNLRTKENKERCPWTYMGLVAEGTLQIVAVNTSKYMKEFEGLEQEYLVDLKGTHEKVLGLERRMANGGYLVRFLEVELDM